MDEKVQFFIWLMILSSWFTVVQAETINAPDFFRQRYVIVTNDDQQFVGIARRRQSTDKVDQESWARNLLSPWSHERSEHLKSQLPLILQHRPAETESNKGMMLCHARKKVFFYSRRAATEAATAIVGRIIKLIPIPWLSSPISYLLNRIADMGWERQRYEQEGLAMLLWQLPAEELGLQSIDVARCLSSIQEADHAIHEIHLLLRAWNKWDRYGALERRKLRARVQASVTKNRRHYQHIGSPLTEMMYPVTSKKGSEMIANFARSKYWLTSKPSVSYWFKFPHVITAMRATFEGLKLASTFIPLPIVPSVIRSAFNRAYIKQIQHEGQLQVYWRLLGNEELAKRLRWQSVNPFILAID